MSDSSDLVFANSLAEVDAERFSQYAIHVLCKKGDCKFRMSGNSFRMQEGDLVIWTNGKLVSEIVVSDDFDATVLYVSYQFARKHSPNKDYDIIGNLVLLQNPVLTLTEDERGICNNDLEQIAFRVPDTAHACYQELLGCLVVAFFLDLYHIHKRINHKNPVSARRFYLSKVLVIIWILS